MDIQYGPIKQWPGKLRASFDRISAPFKSTHSGTLKLLESELRAARAETAVVQLAIPADQWRRDGQPYAGAKSQHPGVIVSFMKPIRKPTGRLRIPLAFPCDRFTTWESNLRAVALGLEALRKVDRYGVTQNSEQYTGFKQLPPPGPEHVTIQTLEDAAVFIGNEGGPVPFRDVIAKPEAYRTCYRRAAMRFHPDSGTEKQAASWAVLQASKTLLDHHHGL